jgi:uncharacterized repeat protein (TIGR01451 family)
MKLHVFCLGAILGLHSVLGLQAQDVPIPPIPEIFGFWPTNGSPGTIVTIEGTNFFAVQSVQFNGVNATAYTFGFVPGPPVTGWVRVPEGATTGPITVETLAGTARSTDSFVVLDSPAPVITGLGSNSGGVGDVVTVTGSNFVDIISVQFNGMEAKWASSTTDSIFTYVPDGATTGLIKVVTQHGQAVSAAPFTIVAKDLAPVITNFSPLQGPPGTWVNFNGVNLDGITSVQFDGVNAQFDTMFGGEFLAKVPAGATTGPIAVQTQQGIFTTSNSFTVVGLVPPVIQEISPSAAGIGTLVVIRGLNFDQIQAVLFNGTPAPFSLMGDLWATVPTNATTGPITVVTSGGSAVSAAPFTPLPTGDLLLTQTASTQLVTTGHDLIYTLVVTNRGPTAVSGVQITNLLAVGDKWTLPALVFNLPDEEPVDIELPSLGQTNAFQIQSVMSSQGTAGVTNDTILCNLGSLNVGESAIIFLTVRAFQLGRLNHLAVVRTADWDLDVRSNFSLTTTRVVAPDEVLIQLVAPSACEISWSDELTNIVVQSRTLTGSWADVPDRPAAQNGRFTLRQATTDPPQIYRLRE